jgi:signal transduction histidine kinase
MDRPMDISAPRPRRGARRLAAALAVALALIASGAATPAAALAEDPRVQRLDRALVSGVAPGAPDGATPSPAERPLPDAWAGWSPAVPGVQWYRLAFDRPPSDVLPALYIERVCRDYGLRLNGHELRRPSPATRPPARLCGQPQLVTLPPSLLRDGSNSLELQVVGGPLERVAARRDAGGLSVVEIGPRDVLERRHALATTLRVQLPLAIAATLILMGGFLGALGWRHRRESHLAYFGALSIGWGLLQVGHALPMWPEGLVAPERLEGTLLAGVTLAAVLFLLRYARWRHAGITVALVVQVIVAPTTLAMAGADRVHAMAVVWELLFAFEIAIAAGWHLWRRRIASGRVPWSATALLGIVGLALVHDLFARQMAGVPDLQPWAPLVAPLALVLVGLRLVRQHGQALQASEQTRERLEERVREATAEIERNFRQLSELRVEQVTERERKRIAADLHDDLGAKLLTIVHTSEDARISTLAREALEEMRLSVRGLTGKAVRLDDALGDWRAELMARLAQSGIRGEWASPEEMSHTLSARAYVQTTRILREATSNVIKHSGASHCAFTCAIADGDLLLTIQDNGGGIPMELDGRLDRGHGMATMKHRAKQMQGQCLVESGPGYGTVIRLSLPLDEAMLPTP